MNEIKMFDNDDEIKEEHDLNVFKRLTGNRSADWSRVKKIIASIESVGYIPSPIIVNERMEVIDGQGRVEACSYLGLPIKYIIVRGAGLDECIAMNISGTKWSIKDYIESYAETGIEDYKRLLDLLRRHPDIGVNTVLTAALGKQDHNTKLLRAGQMELSEEQYKLAIETLDYIGRYVPFVKDKSIPNMGKLYEALVFLHCIEAVNDERMYRAFTQYYAELGGYSTTAQALDALETIYNKKLSRQNKVFVASEYRSYMASKLPWYEGRYGKNYRR